MLLERQQVRELLNGFKDKPILFIHSPDQFDHFLYIFNPSRLNSHVLCGHDRCQSNVGTFSPFLAFATALDTSRTSHNNLIPANHQSVACTLNRPPSTAPSLSLAIEAFVTDSRSP